MRGVQHDSRRPAAQAARGRAVPAGPRCTSPTSAPDTLHLAVVRSPHRHARIRAIDVAAARAPAPASSTSSPSTTCRSWPAPSPCAWPSAARCVAICSARWPTTRSATSASRWPPSWPTTATAPRTRWPCVQVEYEPLPVLVDARAAAEPGAPLLFESEGTNAVATYTVACGDVDQALRGADLVLRERFYVQRHAGVPLETRGALADWDAGRGVLSMWGMTKVPHINRRIIAEHAGLPEHGVHFLQTDVGGAFGIRGEVYPEDFLVALLAIRTRRPVRWIEDRREHLQAANHSREQHHEIAIGLRRDGTIVAIHDRFWNNMGAYVRTHGATAPNNTAAYIPGPYRVPHYRAEVTCVVTNKTPSGTYRAPGRFEATFVRERIVDMAARALGMDPAEIRRRNFIPSEAMPYDLGTTTHGSTVVYDSGDYPQALRLGARPRRLRRAPRGAGPGAPGRTPRRHRSGLRRREVRARPVGVRPRARGRHRPGRRAHRHPLGRAGRGDRVRAARRRRARRALRGRDRALRRHRRAAGQRRCLRQPRHRGGRQRGGARRRTGAREDPGRGRPRARGAPRRPRAARRRRPRARRSGSRAAAA